MAKNITRRAAIKAMVAGGAGIAAGTSLLTSCKSKANNAPATTYVPAEKTSDKIVRREWASVGETVGLLGLGCMRLPQVSGQRGRLDQPKVNEMVDYSLSKGINYFDTAPAYGDSERAMGEALSRHDRSSYLLATKMSNFSAGADEQGLAVSKAMFENSLKNLKTDYFDFFLCHNLANVDAFNRRFVENGVFEYLQGLKAAGKIRHLGFSFHGSNKDMEDILALPVEWDFVQIQMNYFDWKDMPLGGRGGSDQKCDAETLYNMITAKNIPVIVMEPIRGGALANVNPAFAERFEAVRPDLSPAGMALSFAASWPGVMCVLSGMSNMDQLTENVDTFRDFVPLTEDINEMLYDVARVWKANPVIGCTACSYCMPCPNGLNIPGNFKVYDTCSGELNLPDPDGPHDKEYKQKRKIFLNRYNKSLQETEKAYNCTKCNVCVSKCPQRIRIPDQLQTIADLVKKLEA